MSNFDSLPLTFDPALFPGKNISNIAKNNRIFPEREKGEKYFILTYLDISMGEVFQHYCLLAIFRRKRGVKVGPKVLTLSPSLFHMYSNLSKIFETVFLLSRLLPLLRIPTILYRIGEVEAKKPPKKGYFVDAELVHKILEMFNLATTNAILMKLATIIL